MVTLFIAALATWGASSCVPSSSSEKAAPFAKPVADAATGDADAPATRVSCIASPKPIVYPSGDCASPRPAAPDSLDEALARIALDRCSLRLLPAHTKNNGLMNTEDPRRLVDFDALLEYPLRLPGFGSHVASSLDAALRDLHPVASAIAFASLHRGGALTWCLPETWTPDANDPTPLATALAKLGQGDGTSLAGGAPTLPLEFARALVPIVYALDEAKRNVESTVAALGSSADDLRSIPSWVLGSTVLTQESAYLALDKVDTKTLDRAALQLAFAIEEAKLERFANLEIETTSVDTPFGRIVIGGPGADTYDPGGLADGAALVIDVGGDDRYRVPVGAGVRAASVAIDLGGSDQYGYPEVPVADDNAGRRLPSDGAGRTNKRTASRVFRQGAGHLGIGLLFDRGKGSDTYRSLAFSQGAALFGVGVLYDDGGDDSYAAEIMSQGAGAWGIGLLVDAEGQDAYVAYNRTQGFGFTQGIGILTDGAGDDTYVSDPGDPAVGGDPLYPSAQLPGKANTSMAQGAGMGYRADTNGLSPGRPMPGGLGILRDASGRDHYTTSVYGQATGFAMGAGMLLEGGGDDTYEGFWYVQGTSAHTAWALFVDAAGSDRYNPTFAVAATSIGVGHDFGAAVHHDADGDDEYRAPSLSLGSGNSNGIGIFVNTRGADTFAAPRQPTMGGTNMDSTLVGSWRMQPPTVGVFVKAGGTGQYTVGGQSVPYAASAWSFTPHNTPDGGVDGGATTSGERSVGIDRPNGDVALP